MRAVRLTATTLTIGFGCLAVCSVACRSDRATIRPQPDPSVSLPTPNAAPTSQAPTATGANPTSMPSPTPEQSAVAEATATLTTYYDIVSALSNRPVTAAEARRQLQRAATAEELDQSVDAIGALRALKQYTRGHLLFDQLRVEHVDLRNVPDGKPIRRPTVRLRICLDSTGTTLLDDRNRQVATPERADSYDEHVELTNSNWRSPRGWRVSNIRNQPSTCSTTEAQ